MESITFESRSDKLGKIKREIQEEKAEAERRAAVVKTKQLGSVIEMIDMLRDELKRRNQVHQEITDMHKEIEEIKLTLAELKDNLGKLKRT
jgi:chromosome segregation ATPase